MYNVFQLRSYRRRNSTKSGSGALDSPQLASRPRRSAGDAVSDGMYGFGVDDAAAGEPQLQEQQGPKWFREQMEKVSGQLGELKAENDRLKETQRQTQVAEALKAKGYAPQAAGLFTGDPTKLDDWLSANGAALAKTGTEGAEQGQEGVQGTPQTVISPESQAALQQMAAAGQGGAAALSGDDQLTARLNAAQSREELVAIMRESGSQLY